MKVEMEVGCNIGNAGVHIELIRPTVSYARNLVVASGEINVHGLRG